MKQTMRAIAFRLYKNKTELRLRFAPLDDFPSRLVSFPEPNPGVMAPHRHLVVRVWMLVVFRRTICEATHVEF
jgi:hypothetical protein